MEDDEDEFLYGSETKRLKPDEETAAKDVTENMEADDGEDEEEDDDSDIEFLIDTKPGQRAEAPSRQVPYAQVKDADKGKDEGATGEVSSTTTKREEKHGGLNIEAVAEYNGRPVTQINMEEFEDKPWRKPGADITDYFNYGFDEFTWTAYCSKQDNLRDTFTPQKMMGQMMGMPMFPPEMMGQMMGMPGMPPNMMGQMMGMPGMPPPNMMGQMMGMPGVPPNMPGVPPNMPGMP
jgi:pre-mRNA 3'-end-processing factor FIP1